MAANRIGGSSAGMASGFASARTAMNPMNSSAIKIPGTMPAMNSLAMDSLTVTP